MNMTTVLKTTVSAAVVAGLMALATNASAETKLVYGTPLPTSHVGISSGMAPFFEKVKESSGGDVNWEIVAGGAMGNWTEAFENLSGGVLDGASIVDITVAADLPMSNVITDLGVVGTDPRVMGAAVNEVTFARDNALMKDWLKNGVRPMAAYSTSPFYIMCRDPIKNLEDLKSKKIRADSYLGVLVAALGATPVNIQSVEIYEALQRGQIDCAAGSAAWLSQFSLADHVNYIIDMPIGMYHSGWIFSMNQAKWEGLSVEQKKAHLDNLASLVRESIQGYVKTGEEDLEKARNAGKTLAVPDGFAEFMAEYRPKEFDRVKKAAADRGFEGADIMISQLQEAVDKWQKIVAEANGDWDAYQEALEREIFSKVKN